jgi:hypothetical protein
LIWASVGLPKSNRALGSCPKKVDVLVCLRGGWQECAEVAERAELASHHAFEVRSHLWIVRYISTGDLLGVMALRRASSVVVMVVVVHVLVEG